MVIACARVTKARPRHQCMVPSKHVRTTPCRWMSPNSADWCFGGKVGAFNAEFLILWGARWGPAMREVRPLTRSVPGLLCLKPISAGQEMHQFTAACLRLPCSWPRPTFLPPQSSPALVQAPQRWLTSALVHQNFMHLLSNCLLFAGLASQMERKYGTWRIALLFLLSAIGGNLFR